MTQQCSVLARASELYIGTWHLTHSGVWLFQTPLSVLPSSIDNESLGRQCLQFLNASVTIPDPDDYSVNQKELVSFLSQLGFKSSRQFFKGTRQMIISCEGGSIILTPEKQMKISDQYDLIPELSTECGMDPKNLGAAIRERLRYCTLYEN